MTAPEAWIGTVLNAARPQAVAALLRYFRDLDTAEEAFQEASLRALRRWPETGPPRNPAAWLIMVGRNAGVDALRRRAREDALPDAAPPIRWRQAGVPPLLVVPRTAGAVTALDQRGYYVFAASLADPHEPMVGPLAGQHA